MAWTGFTFETPEDLQKAIGLYFEKQKPGNPKPTVSAMCLFIGIKSYDTLMRYRDRGADFAKVFDEATDRIKAWEG